MVLIAHGTCLTTRRVGTYAPGLGTMDPQPTLFVGRVSDVGPSYIVLGATRIELRDGETPTVFHLGHSVSVMAAVVDGRCVGGSLVRDEGS